MNGTLSAMHDGDDDPTEEQLLAYWQSDEHGTRNIRSHRAPKRHPHLLTLGVTTALALGVIGGPDTTGSTSVELPNTTSVLALPADEIAPLEVPITTSDEEKRRRTDQARASRDDERQQPPVTTASVSRVTAKRPTPTPRWVSPIDKQKITSCYGPRGGRTHKGIDFSAPTGTKIRAVGPGVVVQAGWRYSGLGNSVVIKHGNGQMSVYGHASRVLVRPGQRVSAGSSVALVGSTGNSTGPHLHFGYAKTSSVGEIFNTLTNPAPWLRSKGVRLARC